MIIANFVVHEGLVAQKNTAMLLLMQIAITTADYDLSTKSLVGGDNFEPTIPAQVLFGHTGDYLSSWIQTRHLVQDRIDALAKLADAGAANRFSHSKAYLLFAINLFDCAYTSYFHLAIENWLERIPTDTCTDLQNYCGVHSLVLYDLEAYEDVALSTGATDRTWTVPPSFIDSVCHLTGFVMKVSDAIDAWAKFCVTPDWGSLRLVRPLTAGGRHRSYVRMIPDAEDPTVYHGDVYIL